MEWKPVEYNSIYIFILWRIFYPFNSYAYYETSSLRSKIKIIIGINRKYYSISYFNFLRVFYTLYVHAYYETSPLRSKFKTTFNKYSYKLIDTFSIRFFNLSKVFYTTYAHARICAHYGASPSDCIKVRL